MISIHADIKAIKGQSSPEKREIMQVYEYTPEPSKYDQERQELILEQQELQGIISDEPRKSYYMTYRWMQTPKWLSMRYASSGK